MESLTMGHYYYIIERHRAQQCKIRKAEELALASHGDKEKIAILRYL
ncbi:hypothetical protein [Eubacterium oxidoreducens]|nr:hypothetical protein [Eubacterium oxidoreducens]